MCPGVEQAGRAAYAYARQMDSQAGTRFTNAQQMLTFNGDGEMDWGHGYEAGGHVDGVGTIRAARPQGGDYLFQVQVAPELTRTMVEKGSITIDGVSLTITAVGGDTFSVSLIPHTREVTTLGRLRPGSRVNIEVDLLAKYVQKLVRP